MRTHQLKANKGNKKQRIVGRGGKRGKTSGRGTKGQKARAGHKIRPAIRDIIKKLPKLRGRGIHPNKPVVKKPAASVNVSLLSRVKAETITPETLVAEGFVRRIKGRVPSVKILGDGEIAKAVKISGCLFSAGARKKIEEAGGTIN